MKHKKNLIQSIINPETSNTIKDMQQFYQEETESDSKDLSVRIDEKIKNISLPKINYGSFRYYIISPPMKPKRLASEDFTIGRDKDNTITLTSIDVSRFHCKITEYQNYFVLIDNNSANGTFVNNDYIDFHILKDGDKIVLGNNVLEFRVFDLKEEKELAPKSLSDTLKTSLKSKKELFIPRKANSFSGDMEAIQLYQVLQILALDEKTGCLTITNTKGEKGKVYLIDGLVVQARFNNLENTKAVLEILCIEKGSFAFDSTVCQEVEMTESVEFLLFEYARITDETTK